MANNRQAARVEGLRGVSRVWEFAAPVEAVFRAHTDPLWLSRWVAPDGVDLRFNRWDARTGGSWSYTVSVAEDSWTFFGSFHEITSPLRIVQTVETERDSQGPVLEVIDFHELVSGGTRLETLAVFTTPEAQEQADTDHDGGFPRLEEILAELLASPSVGL